MSLEIPVPAHVLQEAHETIEHLARRHDVSPKDLVAAMQSPNETFLTVSMIAEILAVNRRTVGRYREENLLDAIDINPSDSGRAQWRFPKSSLEAFLDRMRNRRDRPKAPVYTPVILERQRKAREKSSRRRKRSKHPHLV